ncbi:endonuclease domain-containing protein [Advenella mimigardefordensis]|uniref:endonuclease domain-containing protein n=1 Tax=Advenella mimigardefordensis TaxID=302406 RepID=UPI00046CC808|nr:DUF559 domain-containing protein [Advenella mimigardefordensis]
MDNFIKISDAVQNLLSGFTAETAYLDVSLDMPLAERFSRIKHNYRLFQKSVDAGKASWMETDQYRIADWSRVFTPIEAASWEDIRFSRIPLWPQLPVDRFFLDFGNPIVKVGLECDGKQWHDQRKDAERDAILKAQGWIIFRAEGWRCNRVMPYPDDFDDWSDYAQANFRFRRRHGTMEGLIDTIKHTFEHRA